MEKRSANSKSREATRHHAKGERREERSGEGKSPSKVDEVVGNGGASRSPRSNLKKERLTLSPKRERPARKRKFQESGKEPRRKKNTDHLF